MLRLSAAETAEEFVRAHRRTRMQGKTHSFGRFGFGPRLAQRQFGEFLIGFFFLIQSSLQKVRRFLIAN